MFADLMGGSVNAERDESGAITGYTLTEFGEICAAFEEPVYGTLP